MCKLLYTRVKITKKKILYRYLQIVPSKKLNY